MLGQGTAASVPAEFLKLIVDLFAQTGWNLVTSTQSVHLDIRPAAAMKEVTTAPTSAGKSCDSRNISGEWYKH
jgi:hypothetical protein